MLFSNGTFDVIHVKLPFILRLFDEIIVSVVDNVVSYACSKLAMSEGLVASWS